MDTIEWEDGDFPIAGYASFHDMTIEIVYDTDNGFSPRDWDNLSVMVCNHRNYQLGDRELEYDEENALNRGGWPLLSRYLRMCNGVVAILPLWLYDHSGISISTGQTDIWDSGQIGFAYVDKEGLSKMGTSPEDAERVMRSEIEEYDSFLRGEVYGYVVKLDDEVLDSCWGFVGDISYVQQEAAESAKYAYKSRFPISETRERVGV